MIPLTLTISLLCLCTQSQRVLRFQRDLGDYKEGIYLAASPDGIISCTCCGEGLLEIKCPYKHRNTPPSEVQDPSFCLQCGIDSQLRLPQTHNYYSQVQGRFSVCDKEFCDLIRWELRRQVATVIV